MGRLDGKTVLLTGAASGIGHAQALKVIEEGASLIAFDMNEQGLDELYEEIKSKGGEAVVVSGSVADGDDVKEAVAYGLGEFGHIDVLCNTAGIFDNYAMSLDLSEKKWDMLFAVNVKGPWLMCNAVLPSMVERGAGTIVNMCSLAGLTAGPGGIAYVPTKYAMVGLTKELCVQYGPMGIRVNGIAPGTVMTPLIQQAIDSDPTWLEGRLALVPSKRLGQASDIADLTVFLASDESSWINGEVISIDGGRNALG